MCIKLDNIFRMFAILIEYSFNIMLFHGIQKKPIISVVP
jgi:hypothetical protein